MQNVILLLFAVLAGAVLPLQATLNAKMGNIVHSPAISSFISFLIGTISLLIYILVAKIPLNTIGLAKSAPSYVWFAGILGAFYVTTVMLLIPRLGVALTFGLIIFGQMFISILLDHFGLLDIQVNHISWMRILGILLIITGVILIRNN